MKSNGSNGTPIVFSAKKTQRVSNQRSRMLMDVLPLIEVLQRATELASDVTTDRWQFAVEISSLRVNLDQTDLRWLVGKELLAHGRETTKPGDSERSFVINPSLKFSRQSCFVLTDEGIETIRALAKKKEQAQNRPSWDGCRHELWLGTRLVKRFKLPSRNQEAILAVFEEENWPAKIDDPLPRDPEIDPKRRLQDAIKGLNRNQKSEALRFLGDGTGEGIRWELKTGSQLRVGDRESSRFK